MNTIIVKIKQQDYAPHPCSGCLYEHDAASCGRAPSCTIGGHFIFVEGKPVEIENGN